MMMEMMLAIMMETGCQSRIHIGENNNNDQQNKKPYQQFTQHQSLLNETKTCFQVTHLHSKIPISNSQFTSAIKHIELTKYIFQSKFKRCHFHSHSIISKQFDNSNLTLKTHPFFKYFFFTKSITTFYNNKIYKTVRIAFR